MTEIQKKIRTTSNQVSNDVNKALYDVYKMGVDKGFADGKKYTTKEILENLENKLIEYDCTSQDGLVSCRQVLAWLEEIKKEQK